MQRLGSPEDPSKDTTGRNAAVESLIFFNHSLLYHFYTVLRVSQWQVRLKITRPSVQCLSSATEASPAQI